MTKTVEFVGKMTAVTLYEVGGDGEMTLRFDQDARQSIDWTYTGAYRVTLEPVDHDDGRGRDGTGDD